VIKSGEVKGLVKMLGPTFFDLAQLEIRKPKMKLGVIGVDGAVTWRDTGSRDHSRIHWVTVDRDGNEVWR